MTKPLPHTVASLALLAFAAAAALAADAPELLKPSDPATKPVAMTPSPDWKKMVLTTTFYSEGAHFADFNKDGKLDVVAGPYWYPGPDFSPDKKFAIYEPKGVDPKGYSENFLAFTHDFNGDGWADVLVYPHPGKAAHWYENPKAAEPKPGPEGYWKRHKVLDGVDNESPEFTDVDGDGKPDVVCTNGGHLGYATADASDPTKPWTFHRVSANGKWERYTHGIGFGDVNGDGRVDLLMREGWWEQPAKLEGDAEWKHHKTEFGKGGAQIRVYDVNGDGKNDVITSVEAHGYGLVWYEQRPGEKWEKHVILGDKPQDNPQGIRFSQLHAIDVADIDGDSLKDIVTGKRYWAHGPNGDAEPAAPAVLYVFKLVRKDEGGAKKAAYLGTMIDNDSGIGTQVVAGDLNGDGKPDIVVGNKKGTFVHVQK